MKDDKRPAPLIKNKELEIENYEEILIHYKELECIKNEINELSEVK